MSVMVFVLMWRRHWIALSGTSSISSLNMSARKSSDCCAKLEKCCATSPREWRVVKRSLTNSSSSPWINATHAHMSMRLTDSGHTCEMWLPIFVDRNTLDWRANNKNALIQLFYKNKEKKICQIKFFAKIKDITLLSLFVTTNIVPRINRSCHQRWFNFSNLCMSLLTSQWWAAWKFFSWDRVQNMIIMMFVDIYEASEWLRPSTRIKVIAQYSFTQYFYHRRAIGLWITSVGHIQDMSFVGIRDANRITPNQLFSKSDQV